MTPKKEKGKMDRKSARLKKHDYSQPGYYFATICVKNQECILGKVQKGKSILNDVGQMVKDVWSQLPERYTNIELDEFIIMPNHVHGIICIVGAPFMAPCAGTNHQDQGVINHAPTLGEIVRTFKAICTYNIRSRYLKKFEWQRNYYEHVIRNEKELYETRQYIRENPQKWDLDSENPHAVT